MNKVKTCTNNLIGQLRKSTCTDLYKSKLALII